MPKVILSIPSKNQQIEVQINDHLDDTWEPVVVGEISPELEAENALYNYDLNIWADDFDGDGDYLKASIYPYYVDKENTEYPIQTDHGDDIECLILGIKYDEDETQEYKWDVNRGHFYYDENHDKIECPVCERSCYNHDLQTSDELVKGEVVGCTDCMGEQKMFSVYYGDSKERDDSMMDLKALNTDHARTRMKRLIDESDIGEIEDQ
jgi:hypothetical protein